MNRWLLTAVLLAAPVAAQPPPPPPLTMTPSALAYDYAVHWAKYVVAMKLGNVGTAQSEYNQFLMALRRYRVAVATGNLPPDQPSCVGCLGTQQPSLDGIGPFADGILQLKDPQSVGASTPATPAAPSTFLMTLASQDYGRVRTFARHWPTGAGVNAQIVVPPHTNTPLRPTNPVNAALDMGIDPYSNQSLPSTPYSTPAGLGAPVPAPSGWGPWQSMQQNVGLGY